MMMAMRKSFLKANPNEFDRSAQHAKRTRTHTRTQARVRDAMTMLTREETIKMRSTLRYYMHGVDIKSERERVSSRPPYRVVLHTHAHTLDDGRTVTLADI